MRLDELNMFRKTSEILMPVTHSQSYQHENKVIIRTCI